MAVPVGPGSFPRCTQPSQAIARDGWSGCVTAGVVGCNFRVTFGNLFIILSGSAVSAVAHKSLSECGQRISSQWGPTKSAPLAGAQNSLWTTPASRRPHFVRARQLTVQLPAHGETRLIRGVPQCRWNHCHNRGDLHYQCLRSFIWVQQASSEEPRLTQVA